MCDYDIEETLAKFGGKANNDVKRTCGNCLYYLPYDYGRCVEYEKEEEYHKAQDKGCFYHRTSAEQSMLNGLIKARQDAEESERVAIERRDGTGQCKDCPWRRKDKNEDLGMDLLEKRVRELRFEGRAQSIIAIALIEKALEKLKGIDDASLDDFLSVREILCELFNQIRQVDEELRGYDRELAVLKNIMHVVEELNRGEDSK